jgi:hypothetical protein
MMLSARGAFSVAITGSPALREVFISGCGVVAVRGAGAYTADGHASTPLTPSLVSVQLRA